MKLRNFAITFSLIAVSWTYVDDNGNPHDMTDPAPNTHPNVCIFDDPSVPTIEDIIPKPDPEIVCGKFYISTDDPNVWIEVDDRDVFDIDDGWYYDEA